LRSAARLGRRCAYRGRARPSGPHCHSHHVGPPRQNVLPSETSQFLRYFGGVALRHFFRRSRISVSNSTSRDGFGGSAGLAVSVFCNCASPRIARNSTAAMIRKLMTIVRKLPHASTAPCFFASANDGAVPLDDNPM